MQSSSHTRLSLLAAGIAALQALDIAIHAATNQLEPVRVLSNMLILAWLVAVRSDRFSGRVPQLTLGLVGTYLAFNLFFLANEGLTNPDNGQPRVALFLLVGATLALAGLLAYLQQKRQ